MTFWMLSTAGLMSCSVALEARELLAGEVTESLKLRTTSATNCWNAGMSWSRTTGTTCSCIHGTSRVAITLATAPMPLKMPESTGSSPTSAWLRTVSFSRQSSVSAAAWLMVSLPSPIAVR